MISQRMVMHGGSIQVNSSGVGDTRISGLVKIFDNNFYKTHSAFGLSLPTGNIDNDATSFITIAIGLQNAKWLRNC